VIAGVKYQKWFTPIVSAVDTRISSSLRPVNELLDAATCSTDLAGVAERLMSPVPEQRAEALLEMLAVVGAADAGRLTAVDAAGRQLVVATYRCLARGPGVVTRQLTSPSGDHVGALQLDNGARPPQAGAALEALLPHAAAIATVVSRRSRLRLTPRERHILCAIAAGHTNAEISRRDSISVRTVTTHVESIFRKLGVRNRVQAARVAIDCGLDYSAGFTSAQGLAAS
jgi:DNA-binding CsgD family transcriptional regulator